MKKPFFFLLLLTFCIGCTDGHKLTFEPLTIHESTCDGCPRVSIEIPKALNELKIAQAINTALSEEIIYQLSFDENSNAENLQEAVNGFSQSYFDLDKEFPENNSFAPWEVEINGEVAFENDQLITIKLDSYTFTGGAHGYGSTTYLNFDKNQGTELDNWQLFEDYEALEALAESRFRKQEKIPEEAKINHTGFMFNGNHFHLADNMGFTQDGLKMVYNQYEVASYADGPIILILPYDQIQKFLKFKIES